MKASSSSVSPACGLLTLSISKPPSSRTCHTAGAEDMGSTDMGDATPQTIDFRVMVHKIHNGAHLPSVQGITTAADGSRVYGAGTPYIVGTTNFSGINFPSFPNYNIAMPKDAGYSSLAAANRTKEDNVRKGVTSCFNCHGDPDGNGPLPSPTQGEKAYDSPSHRACGACHDDIDWTKPYAANGTSMPANPPEAACNVCHAVSGTSLSVKDAHVHPVINPNIAPTTNVTLTGVLGGSGQGGKFLAGDSPSVTFTVKDSNGADVPITYFDSFSLAFNGPTTNRQVVIPGALTATPFDITGRLASAVTTGKGIMSKVYPTGAAVSETFVVDFSSATAFSVSGTVSGALGNGALAGSPGTYPNGGSFTNIVLKPSAVAQNITIAFSGPTSYTVSGSVTGGMGSGNLPASTSNTQRFTSSDGTVSFNVVIGATAPAAGNTAYMTVFKGSAANPVLFAVVGGRTAFSATDRFYFDFIAPAPSYSLKVPMDLQFEFLGDADGSPNQAFTAGNLPVYYGRQTLMERTGLVGAQTVTTAVNGALARYLFIGAIDPDSSDLTQPTLRTTAARLTAKMATVIAAYDRLRNGKEPVAPRDDLGHAADQLEPDHDGGDDGRLDREIRMPVSKPSSCMFGGPDLGTLYVTSAVWDTPADALKQEPLAGGLFAVDVGVKGVPEPRFAG